MRSAPFSPPPPRETLSPCSTDWWNPFPGTPTIWLKESGWDIARSPSLEFSETLRLNIGLREPKWNQGRETSPPNQSQTIKSFIQWNRQFSKDRQTSTTLQPRTSSSAGIGEAHSQRIKSWNGWSKERNSSGKSMNMMTSPGDYGRMAATGWPLSAMTKNPRQGDTSNQWQSATFSDPSRNDVPGWKHSGGICCQLLPWPAMASPPEFRREAGRCVCIPGLGLSPPVWPTHPDVGERLFQR